MTISSPFKDSKKQDWEPKPHRRRRGRRPPAPSRTPSLRGGTAAAAERRRQSGYSAEEGHTDVATDVVVLLNGHSGSCGSCGRWSLQRDLPAVPVLHHGRGGGGRRRVQ